MNDIVKKLSLYGAIPLISIKNAEQAAPLARALSRGGIPCIEVTFRTAAAEESIRNISKECPNVLVGAGTVLKKEQVDRAVDAGAKFIVSPGFNPEIVKYCISKNITIIPGCATGGEMERAMELGIDAVKFFPAEASGGVAYLKAVSGPYKGLSFMATGGVDKSNLKSYLALDSVFACGGSFLAPSALLDKGDYDGIERIARETMREVLDLKIKHVGINCDGEAEDVAQKLCALFGVSPDDRGGAIFAGSLFEVLKKPYLGRHGHIAVGTASPERARAYLERAGFEFDEETATYDDRGRLKVVYAKGEIGGFAFHLIHN